MTEPAVACRASPLSLLGVALAAVSLVLVVAPALVHDPDPAPDLFEATERHVRWGLGISIGAMLFVGPWRRPWSVVFAWFAFCVSGGYLLARFVGIAIEGPGDAKQWMLVGVEIVICGLAAAWIGWRRGVGDRG